MNEHFNADGLVLSACYGETMENEVLPFLAAHGRERILEGDGGKPLYVCRYRPEGPERGTVVILHGFTESALKFSEIIFSLLRNGYCVAAYDQRGHGRSWRKEGLADSSVTHVDLFEEYERDLMCVCRRALKGMPRPYILLAHSMGGAVGALFLEKHPRVFDRAVLCSPMIAFNRHGLPFMAGVLICQTAVMRNHGEYRFFASTPFDGSERFEDSCATGRERFEWYNHIRNTDPRFRNNGPTYSWLLQSLKASQLLLAPGAVERIPCPVRLYSAEHDREVMPLAQKMFARRLKKGRFIKVKESRHEIYRSADEVLFPWWHEVLEFLKGKEA